MKLKPVQDRVLVKPSPPEDKTKSGLIIPDTAKEPPSRGEVIAVGPGKEGNLMTVHEGDIVMYGKYAGQEIEWQGVKYLVLREEEILVCIDLD